MNRDLTEYTTWWLNYKHQCSLNHTGSSGAMEVQGIQEMFNRGVDKYDLKYTTYIGDSDSSCYSTIAEAKPYGPDVSIVK